MERYLKVSTAENAQDAANVAQAEAPVAARPAGAIHVVRGNRPASSTACALATLAAQPTLSMLCEYHDG